MEKSTSSLIKIALIGTCGAGKTAVWEKLKSEPPFPDSIFIEEAARAYFKSQQTSVSHGFSAQWAIQTLVITNEQREQRRNPRLIVGDRSVLDAVVYSTINCDLMGARMLLDRVRYWIPTYSRLYLLDPEGVSYQADEIRTETPETREALHQGFLEVLTKNEITFELLSGTLEQRVERVKHFLQL